MNNEDVIEYGFVKSPFGEALVARTKKGICCLGFDKTKKVAVENLEKRYSGATFKKVVGELNWKKILKSKLDVTGTDFQMKVWKALLEIPPGEVSTYGRIAKKIKNPKAVRAVGTAVGSNPISYLIPCHRVVPASGGIGKYHWGVKRKKMMLEAEKE